MKLKTDKEFKEIAAIIAKLDEIQKKQYALEEALRMFRKDWENHQIRERSVKFANYTPLQPRKFEGEF